jgi:hypothetical protein
MKTLILILALLTPFIVFADDDDDGSTSLRNFQQELEQITSDVHESTANFQRQMDQIGQDSRERNQQQQQNDMRYDLQRIRNYQRRAY